ncbi:MAG: hypothetical protein UMR38_07305 [Candidatus Izemoplasma sp.]|nr:hypothetical protein [Candidatus Izemoplasma sp.]
MLFFDFINPYLMYMIFVFSFVGGLYALFHYPSFFKQHKDKLYLIVTLLLIYTQLTRYGFAIIRDGFILGESLPFYVCRISSVILLYYVLTKDRHVMPFLFFWGATGVAGIIYPNGPINNIANLTETFFIDHYLLAITPFYLVLYEDYVPTVKDAYRITFLMAITLYLFIPINALLKTDYFYLTRQSIFGELFPSTPSIIFATIHYIIAFGFFYLYYLLYDKSLKTSR